MNSLVPNNNLNSNDIKGEIVHQIPSVDQNFGLSKIEFDEVVALLKSSDETLFERIFLAHFEDCMYFIIKKFKATQEVAYDITMDTMIEFRQKLLLDKIAYGNLRFLFTKMASHHFIKSNAKESKLKDIYFDANDDEDGFEEKLSTLKNAWNDMSIEDRKLLEQFYYLDIPLNKIAEKENKTDSTLRKQKQRAIEKLRNLFFTIYNK